MDRVECHDSELASLYVTQLCEVAQSSSVHANRESWCMATKIKSVARDLRLPISKVDLKLPRKKLAKTKPAKASSTLYYGDNLSVLRDHIKDESVDLIYLDPPFNSSATYNVLFSTPKGHKSGAQIEAFEDTWHWGEQAEQEFAEILAQPNTQLAEVMRSMRQFLGENDMMAYLVMMANRLLELHRVLKDTGSLYLHCDPTASHYLKIVLDGIFGPENFRNEIIWRRTGAHNSAKRFGAIHDSLFFYSKSPDYLFNVVKRPYMKGHVESRYTMDSATGKLKFTTGGNILTGAGATDGESGAKWKGFDPSSKNRHWAIPGYLAEQMPASFQNLGTLAKLDALYSAGLLEITPGNAWPLPVKYLEKGDGQPLQDLWTAQPYTEGTVYGTEQIVDADVQWLGPTAPERLGYQTQKPLGLLERLIRSSSNAGDVVLDPFCGCGTAVHASQGLNRRWIGIDVTHLAITLIEKRLRDAFPAVEFDVQGTPTDYDGAKDLAARDKYQFQWWACSLVNAQPYGGKKKGADGGVDGLIFFKDDLGTPKKMVVSVKGGENVGVTMVKDLIATVAHQKAEIGLFITLSSPTKPMITEAASAGFYKSPTGASFPKIQILEIEALLARTQFARYPNLDAGASTFKRAPVEQGASEQEEMFGSPPQKHKWAKQSIR